MYVTNADQTSLRFSEPQCPLRDPPRIHEMGLKFAFSVTLAAVIQRFNKHWKLNPSTKNTQAEYTSTSSCNAY